MYLRKLMCAIAAAGALAVGMSGTAAHAYGGDGAMNVWQITFSFNCNNAQFCNNNPMFGGTGGFWGWAEFDQPASMAGTNAGTNADIQETGCGHGGGGGGAGHASVDGTSWLIQEGSAGPDTFFITGGTMTVNTHGGLVTFPLTTDDNPPAQDGSNVVSPSNPYDTGITADPGHYYAQEFFNTPLPPGVAAEIQVAYKPAHHTS
jgi:hypothetical protein